MLAPLTLGARAAMLLARLGALGGLIAWAVSHGHAPPAPAVEPMLAYPAEAADTTPPPAPTYPPPPEPPPPAQLTVDYDLSALTMFGPRVGWATRYDGGGSGSQRILRTEDGGDHFAITGPLVDSGTICGYAFIDVDHAQVIVCTGRTDVRLVVHRTSDGGRTWSYVPVESKQDPESMFGVESFAFRDAQHGTFVTTVEDDEARAPVAIFRTNDGGLTWKEAGAASNATIEDLADGHSWALQGGTSSSSTLLRATDGATYQWTPDLTGCTVEELPTFFGPRASLRATCASGVRFARTTDGGNHWTFGEETEPNAVVDFLDADHGWVVGKLGTFATRDGGLTWAKLDDASREAMEVTMLSGSVGFLQALSDQRPVLLRTIDGGKSWRTALALDATSADTLDVEVVSATNVFVYLHGNRGTQLYRSHDGGESFTFATEP